MFLGRRLEALCSLTVSSPVWPSVIFFVLLFVPLFPFITSFSLAKWMKAKSFWTALKKFTQGICFCLFFFFNSLVRSKQNFVLSIVHKSQFILSFCFCDIICTNLQQLLYSFLVSSHVLWRSELTQRVAVKPEDYFYSRTMLFLLYQDCVQFHGQNVHTGILPTHMRHLTRFPASQIFSLDFTFPLG